MKYRKSHTPRSGKIIVFFAALAFFTIVGLLWFLRPSVSELEKRELTKFPEITAASLWDGSAMKQIDLWYSDTYPLREFLIAGNRLVKSLYGDRSSQFIDQGETGEDIPDPGEDTPPAELPELPPEPPEEPEEVDPVNPPGEMAGSLYIEDGAAYGLYFFVQNAVDQYAAVLNEMGRQLQGVSTLYSAVIPINSGIMLDDAVQKGLGASDQKKAIDYCYSRVTEDVHPLKVFEPLREHKDEGLYFRTDHHWTQKGAYYAYREFCRARGFTPHELSEYETMEFPGFLGTFYAMSQSPILGNNPDTVIAYLPHATNDVHITKTDGTSYDWKIVQDVSGWNASGKYGCFAGGDNPISVAHNPYLTDGPVCLVVKDSYGNAFVPFLVDHYSTVYWVDFRYFNGNIAAFAREKGVDDVIVLQNVYNMGDARMVSVLAERVR